MANPNQPNNQPQGGPPRPTPIGGQSAAPAQEHAATPAPAPAPAKPLDPLNKPSLVDALEGVMVMDFNEGEKAEDQIRKLLPKVLHLPKYGEVPVTYFSWKPNHAHNEPLYPYAIMVTRDHFKKWIPETSFAGGGNPMMAGQIAGTLPSGDDQIYYCVPTAKVQEMYSRDMAFQRQKLRKVCQPKQELLDRGVANRKTFVDIDGADIKTREVSVND